MNTFGHFSAFLLLACLMYGSALAQEVTPISDESQDYYHDVEYARAPDRPLLLDLYVPKEAKEPLPLVIWVHGGGWRSQHQNKQTCQAAPLVKHGYVVASIDYHDSDKAKFPAQIEDCKAAIRWLRANAEKYHIDPNRVGVWGRSAGGYLVALLGTAGDVKEWDQFGGNLDQSSRVQAVCDWFGPTDFSRAPVIISDRERGVNLVSKLLGDDVKDTPDPQKAIKASATTYVTSDDPPFLIMHGEIDCSVPPDQSEYLASLLKKAGVDVTLKMIKDTGHGFVGQDYNQLLEADVRPFFDKYLKKNPK